MDHIHMRDNFGRAGLGGCTDALSICDVATGFRFCDPVDSKDADTTVTSMQQLLGESTVGRVYSDNHPSLRAACQELCIAWEGPQPGIHQNNAIIERFNSDVLAGARALLVQAGLPSGLWPLAVQCYCHLESASLQEKEGDPAGASPWFCRHAEHFPGMQIPFGAGVYYLPSEATSLPKPILACGMVCL